MPLHISVLTRLRAAALAACAATSILAGVALADATPVQLVLVYLPSVSNTGATSASGIAELVMPEGEFRINAANLTHLDDDATYVAWAVNTDTNQFQKLGAFNPAPSSGTVHYENVLPDAIPEQHWNLLLLTVEATADAARPSSAHSLAAVFPNAEDDPLPAVLPNTGGASDPDLAVTTSQGDDWAAWFPDRVLVALLLVAVATAGYGVGKRRTSNNHHAGRIG